MSKPIAKIDVPTPHNWGRWGDDDELGALNLVTAEKSVRAAQCVRTGEVTGLSLPIRGAIRDPQRRHGRRLTGLPLPQHFLSVDGGDYAAGDRLLHGDFGLCSDTWIISPHGTTTHVDALCHMWYGDHLYNGHDSSRVLSKGAGRLGIQNVTGVVTRGVLIDVAGYVGRDHLDPGEKIERHTLESAADAQGAVLESGDVVLIRTGWPTVADIDTIDYARPQPGLAYDAGLYLAERDVAVVGMDNSAIQSLNETGGSDEPWNEDLHLLFLWRCGIYLLEMLWLEELAAKVASAEVNEFLFTLAPLPVQGGTASSVQPLCIQ